ncbi:MAG: DUF4114 domain-containing protein [Leptolyngbya sp. SIOISBB]|nr:DUF4114 domain-containing protein [Leptolyngbya sp. SIOISBB]
MKSLSMTAKVLGSIATAAMLTAALPFAANAEDSNIQFGNSWDGPGASLQEQLDALDANIDTVKDESGAELFQPTGRNVRSFLLFEIAGFAPFNTVGLYNSAGTKWELFEGSDEGFTRSDRISTQDLEAADFGTFGLYLTNKNGETFYSEASKNGGDDQFLAYQGSGQEIKRTADSNRTFDLNFNDYLFAFEDLSLGNSDQDYNDFVGVIRRVTEVEAVPEPTAMIGLFAVAGGALAMRRRQSA